MNQESVPPDASSPRPPGAEPGLVLLMDPDTQRWLALRRAFAAAGYEVVPAVGPAELLRFVGALEGALLVLPAASVLEDEKLAEGLEEALRRRGHTLVLLGDVTPEQQDRLPQDALLLAADVLPAAELTRRVRLLVVGHGLGLPADLTASALVGDLAQAPLPALVRRLGRARLSGTLAVRPGRLAFGRVLLQDGAVVAAEAEARGAKGPITGLKAFLRLCRVDEGPVRFELGKPSVPRQFEASLEDLLGQAEEASKVEIPDPRGRLLGEVGPAFFRGGFSGLQQEILTEVFRDVTVQELLDSLPYPDHRLVEELAVLSELGVVRHEAPKPAVQVITDSTCDLPADLARQAGIRILPLTVHFGERALLDRVDLQPGQFYEMLEREKVHLSTSPPEPEAFVAAYGGDAVSVHISAALSKTFEHGQEGRRRVLEGAAEPPPNLELVDSRGVSLGLGLLALFAARMAQRGEEAATIHERLEAMIPRIQTLFIVDTLEYLARGGRIGKARAWLGGLLRIKPILGLADGEIVPLDQVRGGQAAQKRLVDLLAERLGAATGEEAPALVGGIAHANAPLWAERLRQRVEERFRFQELLVGEMGPVVGSHAGPGTVGLAVFAPTAEEVPWIAPIE